ncbi:hypothetical protein APY04_1283 [Hyphomicrobium sulfonivorans]|uniref:Uncharacterized protein n=1 Tax=Hyphomicrobium sulfonivorans TaxID=121290 RepID=A0A109BJX8_HYPSL|nr:hypothetical protein APY04_1283 [Hyphomicrobium sulfonivorans]
MVAMQENGAEHQGSAAMASTAIVTHAVTRRSAGLLANTCLAQRSDCRRASVRC